MIYNTDNLLCFHLNLFNTFEQVEKMISDRNLTDLDPYIIWDSKQNGRLKIWIDSETHNILFWTQKGDKRGTICMSSHYLTQINNMKSIVYDKKVKVQAVTESNISQPIGKNLNSTEINQSILNVILDKISSKGIDSLNQMERDFLGKFSD
jgi:hypothetical protein